jgi:hypothetical protein
MRTIHRLLSRLTDHRLSAPAQILGGLALGLAYALLLMGGLCWQGDTRVEQHVSQGKL